MYLTRLSKEISSCFLIVKLMDDAKIDGRISFKLNATELLLLLMKNDIKYRSSKLRFFCSPSGAQLAEFHPNVTGRIYVPRDKKRNSLRHLGKSTKEKTLNPLLLRTSNSKTLPTTNKLSSLVSHSSRKLVEKDGYFPQEFFKKCSHFFQIVQQFLDLVHCVAADCSE